jgi:hypothetical protein
MSNVLTGSYGLRALDDTGTPIAGAKLYVYEAGTATPLTSYSNEARTAANANPVVADGDGWFGSVYIADDTPAKFVLKDASDNTIQTWDNVNAVLLTSSATVSGLGISIINPLTYGAVGDGVANEAADVQEAINAANAAGGGTVYLLGKTYRCDTQLTMYSDVRILGPGTLDFTQCTDNEYIKCQGSTGTAFNLSANAVYGTASFTATPSGFAAGDMVLIKSGQTVANSVTSGEVNELASSSTLVHSLSDDYNTADTANISEITPLENVTLEDFDILADTSVVDTIVLLDRCRNATIRDVRVSGGDVYAVKVAASIGTRIEKCKFTDMSAAEAVTVLGGSRNTTIENCIFRSCGTPIYLSDSVASNGYVIGLYVLGCDFSRSGNDHIRIERHAFDVHVDGCRFSGGSTYSAVFMTNDGVFSNNVGNEAFGILLADGFVNRSERPWDVIVRNNRARNTTMSIESLDAAFTGNGGLIRSIEISNNQGYSEFSISIVWDGATRLQVERLAIRDNHCDGGTIALTVSGANSVISSAIIEGNVFTSITVSDASTGNITDLFIDSNKLSGDADTYISVTTERDVWCRDNSIFGGGAASTHGINISSDGDQVHVTGNSVDEIDGTGIKVTGQTSLFTALVANNDVQITGDGGEHCLYFTGVINKVVVSNNCCRRDNDTDSNIHLDATVSGDITGVSITGNVISNGTYGIEFTNGDGVCWASGNTFVSIATDEYLGAVGRKLLYSGGTDTADATLNAMADLAGASYTIPANLLQVGDVLRIKAAVHGYNSNGSTRTFTLRTAIGGASASGEVAFNVLTTESVAFHYEEILKVVTSTTTSRAMRLEAFVDTTGNAENAYTELGANASYKTSAVETDNSTLYTTDLDITTAETVKLRGQTVVDGPTMQTLFFTVELLREGT